MNNNDSLMKMAIYAQGILNGLDDKDLKFLFQKWLVSKSTGVQEGEFILEELSYQFKDNRDVHRALSLFPIREFSVIFITELEQIVKAKEGNR